MIQLVFKNRRGGSSVRAVVDADAAAKAIKALYDQGVKHLIARDDGEEIGRIWIDDYGKRNWYCFK